MGPGAKGLTWTPFSVQFLPNTLMVLMGRVYAVVATRHLGLKPKPRTSVTAMKGRNKQYSL